MWIFLFPKIKTVNIHQSQSLFKTVIMVSCGYCLQSTTAKALLYCMKDDDGKPTLQPHKPSLASAYVHPNKDHICTIVLMLQKINNFSNVIIIISIVCIGN